jgi:Arc/MetJ-type ribon-helix-helix transcriptional regulator
MISFRLTDQEYERFRQLCSVRGHGSVSAMVRAAVHHLLGETDLQDLPPHQPEIQTRVAILESHVATLAAALANIDARLTPPRSDQAQAAAQ